MPTRITIEQFYENFEEATVGRWLKREGETVAEKEPLVELITDKATFEYESPAAGTLLQIVAQPKSVLPAGYIIALVGEPGEELPDARAENAALLAQREAQKAADQEPLSTKPIIRKARAGRGVRATPKARDLAAETGVDLEKVAKATGARLVTPKHVEDYLAERG